MDNPYNGKIYVEIVPPSGKGDRIISEIEVGREEFDRFMKPIHTITNSPFLKSDEKEIESIREKRDFFVGLLKDKIAFQFEQYFESIDTLNGYPIKDK